MKGFILALFSVVLVVPLSSLAGTADADFGLGANSSPQREVPLISSTTGERISLSSGERPADTELDRQETKPLIVYTLFRFDSKYGDISVQPVLGNINGAQVRLNW